MEAIAFNASSFAAFLGFVGPLIVGMITGLKTSGKIKAIIGALIITGFAVWQAFLSGGLSGDVFGSILVVIAIWQSSYSGFWKPLGITAWLQEKFPVQIGEKAGEEAEAAAEAELVDEGVPEQTDNSVRADDGEQDVTQDPADVPSEGEVVPEVI